MAPSFSRVSWSEVDEKDPGNFMATDCWRTLADQCSRYLFVVAKTATSDEKVRALWACINYKNTLASRELEEDSALRETSSKAVQPTVSGEALHLLTAFEGCFHILESSCSQT